MMIDAVLKSLGFDDHWVADDSKGILIWERSETKPTYEQLTAAGWKPHNREEMSTE